MSKFIDISRVLAPGSAVFPIDTAYSEEFGCLARSRCVATLIGSFAKTHARWILCKVSGQGDAKFGDIR